MRFYIYNESRIRVKDVRGVKYIDPNDDSVSPVYVDRYGNRYISDKWDMCNKAELWNSNFRCTPIIRINLRRISNKFVYKWCPLIDQIAGGCFD